MSNVWCGLLGAREKQLGAPTNGAGWGFLTSILCCVLGEVKKKGEKKKKGEEKKEKEKKGK